MVDEPMEEEPIVKLARQIVSMGADSVVVSGQSGSRNSSFELSPEALERFRKIVEQADRRRAQAGGADDPRG